MERKKTGILQTCPWIFVPALVDKWLKFCLCISIAIKWYNHIPYLRGVLTKLIEKQCISLWNICSGKGNPAFVQHTLFVSGSTLCPWLPLVVIEYTETLVDFTATCSDNKKRRMNIRVLWIKLLFSLLYIARLVGRGRKKKTLFETVEFILMHNQRKINEKEKTGEWETPTYICREKQLKGNTPKCQEGLD